MCSVCVYVLVYIRSAHSRDSANSTLYLFTAGSEECSRILWASCPRVSPFHLLVCLWNPSCPQFLHVGMLKQAWSLVPGGCELEGTFPAGVGMWPGNWFQGWACNTLEAAIGVFSFLAFKWLYLKLALLVALFGNIMKCPFWFPDSSFRDVPLPGLSLHPSSSMPIGLPTGRKEMAGQVHPLSRSVPGTTLER